MCFQKLSRHLPGPQVLRQPPFLTGSRTGVEPQHVKGARANAILESMRGTVLMALLAVAGATVAVRAQGPTSGSAPTRSVKVFDYQNRIFPTSVELRGTALLPAIKGSASFVGKVGDLDFTATF